MKNKVGPVWVKRAARTVKVGEVVKGVGIVRRIDVGPDSGLLTFTGDEDKTKSAPPATLVAVQMFSLGF